jgi:hypothetical protein
MAWTGTTARAAESMATIFLSLTTTVMCGRAAPPVPSMTVTSVIASGAR